MKKNIRVLLMVFITCSFVCSCLKEEPIEENSDSQLRYSLKEEIAPMTGEDETKGNYVSEGVNSSYPTRYYIYWNKTLLYQGTTANPSVLLNKNAKYTILAHSNINPSAITASPSNYDAFVASVMHYDDVETDYSDGAYQYIPMTYIGKDMTAKEFDMLDGSEDQSITVTLTRIMAKINFSIEFDELTQAMYQTGQGSDGITVNSICLGGLDQSVGLFGDQYNVRYTADDDVIVNQSNDSNPVYTLYIPESLGGNILSDNDDPLMKSAETLEAKGYDPESYPYIEASLRFFASHVTDAYNKIYRLYLGENVLSNFDVKRNHVYNVTLKVGYNGLGYTGYWKITGGVPARDVYLNCYFINKGNMVNSTKAKAGEPIVIRTWYEYKNRADVASTYYLRQNGFAVGLSSERDSYVENGTAPSSITHLAASSGDVTYGLFCCGNCGHAYHDYPMNKAWTTGKRTWFDANLTKSGTGTYSCKWCSTRIFATPADGTYGCYSNLSKTTTWSDDYATVISQTAAMGVYNVPSSALVNSKISLYAWTRDGDFEDVSEITISNSTAPVLSGDSQNWVGQKKLIKVESWPTGTYGSNPTFTFSITCRNKALMNDSSVATLSGATARSVYVECKKAGTYTVSIKYNNTTVSGATATGSISYPSIGYPDSYTGPKYSDGITVYNGGGRSYFATPTYIVSTSQGKWVEYTNYDETLFNSTLGSLSATETDGYGWIGYDIDNPSSAYLNHAYKNGTVSSSNLLPYDSPSTRIGLIRFSSSKASSYVSSYDIPVYFDSKYKNLDFIASRSFTHYICDEADNPGESQSDLSFFIDSYYPSRLINESDGFYATTNNASADLDETFRYNGSGQYTISKKPGLHRLYWRLNGASSDKYDLMLCSASVYQKYIGKIICSVTNDEENILRWTPSASATIPDYTYHISVEAKYVPSELFTLNKTTVSPTTGRWDPSEKYGTYLSGVGFAMASMGGSSETEWEFYEKARIRNVNAYSYVAEFNRYLKRMTEQSNVYRSILQTGWDINDFQQRNSTGFTPATSPIVSEGKTWTKTSDNGTTAIWSTSNGYETCEFNYKNW